MGSLCCAKATADLLKLSRDGGAFLSLSFPDKKLTYIGVLKRVISCITWKGDFLIDRQGVCG
jgi:uncharacterized protein (DUF2237 family)